MRSAAGRDGGEWWRPWGANAAEADADASRTRAVRAADRAAAAGRWLVIVLWAAGWVDAGIAVGMPMMEGILYVILWSAEGRRSLDDGAESKTGRKKSQDAYY